MQMTLPGAGATTPARVVPKRLWLAVAGAVALHALVLLGQRPTLLSSASMQVSPPMSVRFIAAAEHEADRSQEAVQAPAVVPEPPPVMVTTHGERLHAADTAVAPAADETKRMTAAAPPTAAPPASTSMAAVVTPPAPTKAVPDLPPAPDYRAGATLDPGPRPLADIEPEYPANANLQEGEVVLRLLINESGAVDNVAVVRAYPKGLFDASAVEAFAAAKFSPGLLLGVPVKSQVTIAVQFMPINRGAKVSGRGY